MKRVLISIVALLITLLSYGQSKVKSFNKCDTDNDVSKVYQGDTVIIECNVAYILNNNVLNNYYKALQNNRGCTEIVKTYAALSNTQDSVIDQQNKRFDELRAKFDSLGNNTGQFLTITQGSLSQIGDTLSNVSRTIVQTQNLLSQTKLLLEQEQKNKWKDRLKWGIGGVGVGLVASTLVFIAVR